MLLVLVTDIPSNLEALLKEISLFDPGRATIKIATASEILGKKGDVVLIDDMVPILITLKKEIMPFVDIDMKPRRSKGDRHRNKRYRWSNG